MKLVAEAGIGTVASGVAKGNADIIQVFRPKSNNFFFFFNICGKFIHLKLLTRSLYINVRPKIYGKFFC